MLSPLPVLQPAPQINVNTLMVYLTLACPLDCSYCFVKKVGRRMMADTARKVVDFFFSHQVSGDAPEVQINFFGGEPMLELDRMEEILAYASERAAAARKAIVFSVTTSGTVLSARHEALLARYRVAVLLSLDGDPSITGADRPFRGGRSSHDIVLRNLPRLLEVSRRRLIVRTTFHPSQLRLVDRVEYLLGLGVPTVALCPVLDADWEPYEEAINREYQELASWFLEVCRRGSAPPLDITWMLLRQWHAAHQGAPRPARPCPVGHSLMAVDPEGHVLPCHRFLYRPHDFLGTVDAPDFGPRQSYLDIHSSKLPPDCDRCAARPVCGGGCRLVALQRGLGLQDVYSGFCIPMRAHAAAAYRIYAELAREGLLERVLGFKSPLGANLQQILVGE